MKIISVIIFAALSGVAFAQSEMGASAPTQDPVQWAEQVGAQAMRQCRDKRLRGELATYAASVQCSNKVMIAAFSKVHYKYMDLIQTFAAKRLELASMEDRGELTDQQAALEMNKALDAIQEIANQRDSGGR
jgi:hypothetical protein